MMDLRKSPLRPWLSYLTALGLGMVMTACAPTSSADDLEPFRLPEFTQNGAKAWLNTPPLSRADLKGKVVLIDFWTFDCWNCYRSFPWLNDLEKRFTERDLTIVGIHSPEFSHEHERPRVEDKIGEFGLHHPVMMDNDFAFWRAMKNYAWPAFYLVDRQGQVRYRFVGETHAGDAQALAIEHAIGRLLDEPAAP